LTITCGKEKAERRNLGVFHSDGLCLAIASFYPCSAMPAKKQKPPLPDLSSTESVGEQHVLPSVSFPVVGIGASAGGLEAIELFLRNVPEKSGMAFVIVQHLDPTHEDMMVGLLERCTTMKVMQIHDRQKVEPNCVYVIPPNADLVLESGILRLHPPSAVPHLLRLPIDTFFRSLAEDRKEQSIGVILSGMGSDGVVGLRAIKEKGGVVFVQEPSTAKFDSMPLAAIHAGMADVTDIAENLPRKIREYLRYTPLMTHVQLLENDAVHSALETVVMLIREQTRHDFTNYKKTTFYRRIERRMGIHQHSTIADYVGYLQENPQEVELLFREMLIGVTSFFRDAEVWEYLRTEIIPSLLSTRRQHQALRAWVPACSTGEEAYSLAIVFQEALESLHLKVLPQHIALQIFATDLDGTAIEKARKGIFPANIAADVSSERLRRFFVPLESGGYQIAKSIREMVIFAPQNIIQDPPFTKLDILTCRNLLIYLNAELQKKLLPLFHYALNDGGIMVLGAAETASGFTNLFTPAHEKIRLYRRLTPTIPNKPVLFPSHFAIARTPTSSVTTMNTNDNLKAIADKLLLERYAPAAVLTNQDGDILYISGRTGKYLEPPAGKVNWNIFAMAREGLGFELMSAFRKAVSEQQTRQIKGVVIGTNGGKQTVDVSIQPINEPETMSGMVLIVFVDVQESPVSTKKEKSLRGTSANQTRVQEAEHELQRLREEMQTSQEELRSMNEELQSANEELQSTNEELTTSREEMQSMNEELQTVNYELQAKVDELSHTSNDIKNLLDSTDIATLFLDSAMCVRRFNSRISKMTKLIAGDIGRPITDIASELLYPGLVDDAHEVLQTLVSVEKQIHISGEQWFSVRMLPYRTLGNLIDGVVITFTDITISKTLEAELRSKEAALRALLAERLTSPQDIPNEES
jgi:two-component system CheB/CheR fusion protein